MESITELLGQGLRHYASGDVDKAVACWRHALSRDPNNSSAREYLELAGVTARDAPSGLPQLMRTDAVPLPAPYTAVTPTPTPTPEVIEMPPDSAPSAWALPAPVAAPSESSWADSFPVDVNELMEAPKTIEPSTIAPVANLGAGQFDPFALVEVRKPARPVPPPPPNVVDQLLGDLREHFGLGDFSGSLELSRKVLAVDPTQPEALAVLQKCESTLLHMYESKIGALFRVPLVVPKPDEIVWLNLDHRAGFILAQIDGTVTFDDVFSLSGMSRIDTARILAKLLEQGVISAD